MKVSLKLIFLICAFALACGPSKPTFDQMEKALTAFVKKGDPKATATITGTTPTDYYIAVDFQFTNFSGTTEDGEKVTAASGTGLADFWLRDGKWQFDKVVINQKAFKVGEDLK